MNKQNTIFKKKQLALAVSMAMFGGIMTGCSSDDSAPAAGTYTITATGGKALNSTDAVEAGLGGYGGYLNIYNQGGTGGVEVRSSGKANASFSSIITTPKANLGDTPLMVTADTTLTMPALYNTTGTSIFIGAATLYVSADGVLRTTDGTGTTAAVATDDTAIVDGSFYRWSGNTGELFVADGAASLASAGTPYLTNAFSISIADGIDNDGDDIATGLSVASNTTLTLERNGYGNVTRFATENDIVNDGTITTTNNNSLSNRGDLRMMTQGSYIASGDIDTSGADNGYGGNGGDIDIMASGLYNSGNMNSSGFAGGNAGDIGGYGGFVKNSGALTAIGGDGGEFGSNGGEVALRAVYLENTGAINSSAGAADAAGYGGDADRVSLYGEFGVNNSGDITSNGAGGAYGGDGGEIRLDASELGSVRNSGNLSANGGNASDGFGGDGGRIRLYADGGKVVSSGDLVATGGDNSSTHFASQYGGYGGRIDIRSDNGDYSRDGVDINQQADDIVVSGNMDVSGGANLAADGSGYGGYGGSINIALDQDLDPNSPELTLTNAKLSLLGYTGIDVSGGDGGYGGNAGEIYINSDSNNSYGSSNLDSGGGPVVNQADLTARGGNAVAVTGVTTNGYGGYGGYIDILTEGDSNSNKLTVNNTGNIDVSGGSSYNVDSRYANYRWGSNNNGGGVYFEGHYGVTNSGDITLNGGDDLGDAGFGGYGGDIGMMSSLGAVVNRGTIEANGGSGAMMGGLNENYLTFVGLTVNNSGNFSSNGGDADPAVAGSEGGYGGVLEIYGVGLNNSATNNSGTLSVAGGAGETAGVDGCALVGLQQVAVGCSRFLFNPMP